MISFKEYLDNIYTYYVMGEKIYSSLLEYLEGNPETGVVVAAGHIGDTIWLCMYAEAVKKQHGYDKVVYLFSDNQAKLAELYPSIDEIMSISADEMTYLRFYICINNLYSINNIHYGFYKFSYLMNYPNFSRLFESLEPDQLSVYTERMLGIEEKSERNGLQLPFMAELPEWKEMFKNSVMLLPAAISVKSIPLEFWSRLTIRLQEEGYSVYTNYNNLDYEFVVPGTDSISMDFVELAAMGQCFKGFVALRSGACDLLAQADAKLFVLYHDDENLIKCDMKDHKKEQVQGYVWSDDKEDEIINDVLENLK